MRTLRRTLRRLTFWATSGRDEARLRAEIEDHLARQTAECVRSGMAPAEARREAALKFGGVEAMKESYREQRGLPPLETMMQDTHYALRRLRMAPAFTLATVLTLALGIGATTSIFTLVNAVLLKSLPVANPGELYRLGRQANCCYVGGYSQDGGFSLFSYELYTHLRDHTTGFSDLAAFPASEPLLGVRRAGSTEAAQSYPGEFVSGNYFRMFGISAYVGRALTVADDRPGAPPVAVMSYRLWQEKYGSDPSVLGSVFNIDDKPFTVVGVAPPGFFGGQMRPTPPYFFLPLNTEPLVEVDADLNKYDTHWLELIGRIRPAAKPASVEAEMRVGLRQWLFSHWSEMSSNDRTRFPAQTLFLAPGGAGITRMRDEYQYWLQILMAVTGFVLLIVCANVANLMLVRGMARRRQTSLSMALGAPVLRVVRAPCIECVLLGLFGGVAGLAIAFTGARLILRYAFPSFAGLAGVPIDASPSVPVLLFAFVTSLATGIAFGIGPAWMAARVDPIEALRGAAHNTVRTSSPSRKALMVFQVALSLVLLSTAGLLTYSLQRLEGQDYGFKRDRRTVVSVNPRLAGYRTRQLPLLYRRIHDSMTAVPGVVSVALCLYSPQQGGAWGSGVFVDGQPAPGPGVDNSAAWNRVSAGYLDVIGTPLVRGRGITEQDTAASRHVAVVNQAFARKYFPNEDPIGRHFGRTLGGSREFEIVGVAKDASYLTFDLGKPPRPFFFLPETQAEYSVNNLGSLFLHEVIVLARPGAAVSTAALRQAIAAVDPSLPIISIRSLRDQVSSQFAQQRLIARLTSFFGILSLVLASIGLYGVTAYNVGRRVHEVGVRMALGAGRGDVVRLVLGGAFGLIVTGLLIGLPLTMAAGRFLGSQLYGTNPFNPVVTMGAVAALGLSALAAALVPALRASSTSLIDALRTE